MEHLKDIQKKTQGIVTALYMVSDFMNEKEPIKNELRLIGVSLIKDILLLQMSDRGEYYKRVILVRYKIAELQSLVTLGRTLCMVSLMNAKLIDDELVSLSHTIEHIHPTENLKAKSFTIPESVFKEEFKKETVLIDHNHIQNSAQKSHGESLIRSHLNSIPSSLNNYSFNKNSSQDSKDLSLKNITLKTDIKDNRRKDIMDTIKRHGSITGVSIKDITKIFTNVSEKTIQRELTEMLLKGQIKKTGEKRWSRYYPL